MQRAPLIMLAVVTLLVLAPRAALARGHGDSGCKGTQDFGFGSAEAFATVFSAPPLAVNGSDAPRRLVGLPTPSSTDALVGIGADFEFRCDAFVVDVTRLRYSVGLTRVAGNAMADGAAASVSRGPLQELAIGLPAFGFQGFPAEGWKLDGKLDWGLERLWADTTVSGASVAPTTGTAIDWDFYARLQLAGCKRLGPAGKSASSPWGCLTVSPIIYDRAFFTGVSTGFRVDF